jgi:glucose-6-phosphate 1-dehydrogenase
MSHRLVIFGASGDLTSRELMPALARLHEAGKLPPAFSVLGIARDDWGTYRLREALERYPAMSACSRGTRFSLRSSTTVPRRPTTARWSRH